MQYAIWVRVWRRQRRALENGILGRPKEKEKRGRDLSLVRRPSSFPLIPPYSVSHWMHNPTCSTVWTRREMHGPIGSPVRKYPQSRFNARNSQRRRRRRWHACRFISRRHVVGHHAWWFRFKIVYGILSYDNNRIYWWASPEPFESTSWPNCVQNSSSVIFDRLFAFKIRLASVIAACQA